MVQVTDGCTFMIKSEVPNPDYASEMEAYNRRDNPRGLFNLDGIKPPPKYIHIETPCVVPNGKWVLERGNEKLIGVRHEEIETIVLDHTLGWYKPTLWVSDKPFGFVSWETRDRQHLYVEMHEASSLYLRAARQIHKGELGQSIPIPKVSFVSEKLLGPEEGATNGDRQRARMGWVRLVDLVQVSGLGPTTIMNRFIQFGLHSYSDEKREVAMEIVRAHFPEDILGQRPKIDAVTSSEMYHLINRAVINDIWVRRGFANTVLRLTTLEFTPRPVNA